MSQFNTRDIIQLLVTKIDNQDQVLNEIRDTLHDIQQHIRNQKTTQVQPQQNNNVDYIEKPKQTLTHSWVTRHLIPFLDHINFRIDDVPFEEKERKNATKAKENIDDDTWIKASKLFSIIATDARRVVESYQKTNESYKVSYGKLTKQQKVNLILELNDAVSHMNIDLTLAKDDWIADYFIHQKVRGKDQSNKSNETNQKVIGFR
jgi:hypothetical protein